MKKQSVSLRNFIACLYCFLLGMFILGSVFDYQISTAVYNQSNGFGIFFAAFGEYPVALALVAAGIMLCYAHSKTNKLISVLQCFAGGLLVWVGGSMAVLIPVLYSSLNTIIIVCVGLACIGAVIYATVTLCKCADRKMIVRVAAIIFFSIFAEMLIVNLIKIPWGRPRMRLVAEDARAYFMPWWQTGSELKSSLIAVGVASEEFKSFPSGHTASSAILMLLGLIPLLNQKLADKKIMLIGIGFVWACLVAFSRIIMGAHYLTDTVVGLSISLSIMLLICHLTLGKHTKILSATPKL